MDSNAFPGGIYDNGHNLQPGVEMSLHHHTTMLYPHKNQESADYSHNHPQAPQSSKPKNLSDDEEKNNNVTAVDGEQNRKTSPWQRMKWTDNMVRLLIMLVYYIGDEVVVSSDPSDPSSGNNSNAAKKSAAGGGGGVGGGAMLQKKGKWKSVSRAMMERGFHVSPQQCEDKFNDLNKRYKRVNDILGRGTACRVVENQSLLETMAHLSPKAKEEAKKLLNSKHLFFREMCAYHNSCGHTQAAQEGNNPSGAVNEDGDGDDEEEESEEEEDGDGEDEDGDSCDGSSKNKRVRGFVSPLYQELGAELANVVQDSARSYWEKRRWTAAKMLGLEEQRVDILSQALEIEKRRFKWVKFRTEKEREMEREKLAVERLKLENERMGILIRRKEIDWERSLAAVAEE